jgi:hypothetical protein
VSCAPHLGVRHALDFAQALGRHHEDAGDCRNARLAQLLEVARIDAVRLHFVNAALLRRLVFLGGEVVLGLVLLTLCLHDFVYLLFKFDK